MAKGDGSITKRGTNLWEVSLSLGRDPITGKYARKSLTAHGTKADARKARDKLKRDLENGLRIAEADTSFGIFADEWIDAKAKSGDIGDGREAVLRNHVKLLKRYIGNVPLSKIDAQMVERLYRRIRDDKIKERGSYSNTTLRMVHTTMNQIMAKAVDYDLILRNPCERVKAPKPDDNDRRSLTVEESVRLLRQIDATESAAYADMAEKEERQRSRGNDAERSYLRGLPDISSALCARIGLASGMRRGEVLALVWGRVSLSTGAVRVEKSLDAHGKPKAPKSKAGFRTIYLDRETVEHLRAWKAHQAAHLASIGVHQGDETPVCCSEVGSYLDGRNFSRWWRSFRERAGFPGLRFHELRHTQATQLFAQGVDAKTIQTRMGHYSAAFTLDRYAHAVPENDMAAAQKIGDLFRNGREEEPPAFKVVRAKSA